MNVTFELDPNVQEIARAYAQDAVDLAGRNFGITLDKLSSIWMRKGLSSTEHNKAIVRAFVEAINRKDWRRLEELVAPDFARHSSASGQPQNRNREQLRDFLAGEASTFPDGQETIHFLVAEGDKVAVHSGFRGTQTGQMGPFPASGKTLSADSISIYRIADGRIAEAWVEWDCLNGLIQLGHWPASRSNHAPA
jgi:steroid delta-isomerase-like uncharacterized protein